MTSSTRTGKLRRKRRNSKWYAHPVRSGLVFCLHKQCASKPYITIISYECEVTARMTLALSSSGGVANRNAPQERGDEANSL